MLCQSSTQLMVLGGGISACMLALEAVRRGFKVRLVEESPRDIVGGAGGAAGGMLCPFAERETTEVLVTELGRESLGLWPQILVSLNEEVYFRRLGSYVIAHPENQAMLYDFKQKLLSRNLEDQCQTLSESPDFVKGFRSILYFSAEAHLHPVQMVIALRKQLELEGVQCHWKEKVKQVDAPLVTTNQGCWDADLVVDARGIHIHPANLLLRSVRGEALLVEAKDLNIPAPVRLLHPRYPLYIVPRGGDLYYLGATSFETDNDGPISARSLVELLSAAVSVHGGFAESRFIQSFVGMRPALFHNEPRIYFDSSSQKYLQICGLYRHGFLLAPIIAKCLVDYVEGGFNETALPSEFRALVTEKAQSFCK